MKTETFKLVDSETLLNLIFDENSRPSIRWLRYQQKKAIPYIRIGGLTRFDPEAVRAALEKKTIKAKGVE